ncbi:MAG: hypothetical protein QOE70_5307 [Chthoniobacter sp.]|jgi:hypothetical protein|nr:hypothetical protein [Chthoniobacter sp.]
MSAPAKPFLKVVALETPEGVFEIEVRKTFKFLNQADAVSFIDHLGLASGQVLTVAGRTGAVVLFTADITGLDATLATLSTTEYVDGRFSALVGMPPSALDTLQEIAAQLQTDEATIAALEGVGVTKLSISANLSDLADAATARTNLGLGTLALLNSDAAHRVVTDAQISAWNAKADATLSNLSNAGTARTNLGLGTLALLNNDSTHRTVTDAQIATWDAAGGGGAISNPGVAYIQSNGDDATGEIGNPSKPFAGTQAAVDQGARTLCIGRGAFPGFSFDALGGFVTFHIYGEGGAGPDTIDGGTADSVIAAVSITNTGYYIATITSDQTVLMESITVQGCTGLNLVGVWARFVTGSGADGVSHAGESAAEGAPGTNGDPGGGGDPGSNGFPGNPGTGGSMGEAGANGGNAQHGANITLIRAYVFGDVISNGGTGGAGGNGGNGGPGGSGGDGGAPGEGGTEPGPGGNGGNGGFGGPGGMGGNGGNGGEIVVRESFVGGVFSFVAGMGGMAGVAGAGGSGGIGGNGNPIGATGNVGDTGTENPPGTGGFSYVAPKSILSQLGNYDMSHTYRGSVVAGDFYASQN